MDLSFDISNSSGDHILVALSYYDYETIKVFSSDPHTLTLVFYPQNPENRQYAHFICRKEHESAVAAMGELLMQK